MEYLPLAKALAIRRPYALGTIFLSYLYQDIGKYVTEVPYHKVGEALWFVQIWLFAFSLSYQVLILSPPCLWVLVQLNPLGLCLQSPFHSFS